MVKTSRFVVRSLSLPREVVDAVKRRQDSMSRLHGADVSFSAAVAATLREALGVAVRRPRPAAKRKTEANGEVEGADE